MRPDPDPLDSVRNIQSERPIVIADSRRPQFSDTFQVQRWMPGIFFQERKILVCQGASVFGESIIRSPEP